MLLSSKLWVQYYWSGHGTQITFMKATVRAVWRVRGLAAVRCYYTEGGGDCYAKL